MSESTSASESASTSQSLNDDTSEPGGGTPGTAEPGEGTPGTAGEPEAAPDTAAVAPLVTLADEPVPLAEQVLNTTEGAPVAIPLAAGIGQAGQEALTGQEEPEIVQVEDEEVPLAVLDEEDAEGNQELQEIDEQETPLADMALSSGVFHHIQHICELAASGLLPIFLAGSNRKKKKEVSELREQLEEEGKDS